MTPTGRGAAFDEGDDRVAERSNKPGDTGGDVEQQDEPAKRRRRQRQRIERQAGESNDVERAQEGSGDDAEPAEHGGCRDVDRVAHGEALHRDAADGVGVDATADTGDEPGDGVGAQQRSHRRDREGARLVFVVTKRPEPSAVRAVCEVAHGEEGDDESGEDEPVVAAIGAHVDPEDPSGRTVETIADDPGLTEQPRLRRHGEAEGCHCEHEPANAERRDPESGRHQRTDDARRDDRSQHVAGTGSYPHGHDGADRGDGELPEAELSGEADEEVEREADEGHTQQQAAFAGRLVGGKQSERHRRSQPDYSDHAPEISDEWVAELFGGKGRPRLHGDPRIALDVAASSTRLEEQRCERGGEKENLDRAARRVVVLQERLDHADHEPGGQRDRDVRHAGDDRNGERA